VSGGRYGIFIEATAGSVTGNTVFGSSYGIELGVDGVTVTSNDVYGTGTGIDVQAPSLQASVVENNIIKTASAGNGTGIDPDCTV